MKPEIWNQLKNITADEIINALIRDEWSEKRTGGGSRRIYVKNKRLVSIHYHPHKTYGPSQLNLIIADIGWTEVDLKRLKLIK